MDEQEAETTVYHALEIKDLSIIADIKATNPGFSAHAHEYMENCQRCVVAYEARRRGYNVIAKPHILSRTDPLPYMTNLSGWPAVYKDHRLESCAADTGELAKKKIEALMKSYRDKSRAIVKVDWLMRNKGHLADFPDTYRLTEQDEISKTYSLPKSYVSYRKPRTVSTEQRERARQMMIAKNKAKGD